MKNEKIVINYGNYAYVFKCINGKWLGRVS